MSGYAVLAVLFFLLGIALGALFILLLFGRFIIPVVRIGSPVKVTACPGIFQVTGFTSSITTYSSEDTISLTLNRERTTP